MYSIFLILTFVDVVVALLAGIAPSMGAFVSLRPPKRHWLWFWMFLVVGVAGIAASLYQMRANKMEARDEKVAASKDRNALMAKIDQLEKQLSDLSPVPASISELRDMVETPKPEKPKTYANVKVEFAGTKRLLFELRNGSRTETARDPKYTIMLWNYSRPTLVEGESELFQLIPIPTRLMTGEFIHPNRAMGPWEILNLGGSRAKQMASEGDHLFGSINASCANCKTNRCFWFYYQMGHGGWYVEADSVKYPPIGRKYSSADLDAFLDEGIPKRLRAAIPPTF